MTRHLTSFLSLFLAAPLALVLAIPRPENRIPSSETKAAGYAPTSIPFSLKAPEAECEKAGVYVCPDPNWTGHCKYYRQCMGSSPDNCMVLDGKASAIGPDMGAKCLFYKNAFCDDIGGGRLQLEWPGVADLRTNGWDDVVRSYQCFKNS
ncbi:hypothetical protein BCR34DRAFT_319398 [Clohesyomyces aquaticus]|uniref:Uncharacterized protein n=1 Tax=Clohesyomyces aquaticus TaxID=1231657 RepID=A0A1Y1XWJ5_9PLEO|nr:hypothetical protein BCR34DRAFT_319398 [Clohesyomyces aquaticus]